MAQLFLVRQSRRPVPHAVKVDRVLETSLYAQNLDAAELFYTRVLGLEVYSRVEDRHVFFRCGSAMLLVFNPDKTEQEEHWHGCRGRGHVAWAIPSQDLDAWRQWLRAADVPFTRRFPGLRVDILYIFVIPQATAWN